MWYKLKQYKTHRYFKAFRKFIEGNNEFSQRIKMRHKLFWTDPMAEEVRNMPATITDPMDKWQDMIYWQRKLSNKYNAKLFALKMGSKVAELYWKGSNPATIDFHKLPDQYVIRPSIGHSSKHVFLINGGLNLFDNTYYSPETIRAILQEKIKRVPGTEFLIEEFLQEEPGEYHILSDYKFFCFNGEIASCQLINRTGPKAGYGSFYDEHWNSMDAVHPGYPLILPQPKPDCLEEMVAQVKKLSSAYQIFVRIDFYATTKGAVFGEFTPTPGLGHGYSPFGRKLLLSYWDKYCSGLV